MIRYLLDGPAVAEHDREVIEPAGLVVVGVGCFRAVAVLYPGPLAELVLVEFGDVVVPVAFLLAPGGLEQPAVVVGVVEGLPVGVGHLDHPAACLCIAVRRQEKVEGVEGLVLGPGYRVVEDIGLEWKEAEIMKAGWKFSSLPPTACQQ